MALDLLQIDHSTRLSTTPFPTVLNLLNQPPRTQVCHSGPCGPCPEEGERHCPCGKALYPDLKCDEQSPLCGGTCGKVLDCGVHACQERCHYGHCNKVCTALPSHR